MAHRQLIIYGAGGHGSVVSDAARLEGWDVRGFVDDGEHSAGDVVDPGDLPLLGAHAYLDELSREAVAVIVAVGDNSRRDALLSDLMDDGFDMATVVHPAASVSASAMIAPGAYVGPQAAVNADASVGFGAIINTAAVVEHHVSVGRCAHVAPRAVLCGRSVVGDRALVGAGAVLLPRERVGDDAIVGAGSVVIDDVPPGTTVMGSPARSRRLV